jgi:cell fate regulator YaaT (PSP1 superfamily)
MPIYPLPQFEADVKAALAEEDRQAYEALKAPKTMVVRFGAMKMVGEFPYTGSAKPGCGSKIVVRTFRGTEMGDMLTSTCPNSGCSKSVSRKEMLNYIQNSGGRDYPFFTDGKALRVADAADMDKQAAIEQSRHSLRLTARTVAERVGVKVKITDVEPILGGETITVFYLSEERVELRDLIRELSYEFKARVDLRHVGARDEARLTADYEKCGQYCCCKNFLKVLKPISMKAAKVQKATLDPLKISGRCGRLMCCLRYEDSTYEELRKKLPRRKSRVGTPEGDGIVIDSQILTQLVLVSLDEPGPDGKYREVAIAVEDLTPPVSATAPARPVQDDRAGREGPRGGGREGPRRERGGPPARPPVQPVAEAAPDEGEDDDQEPQQSREVPSGPPDRPQGQGGGPPRGGRRRRRRGGRGGRGGGGSGGGGGGPRPSGQGGPA